MDDFKTSTRAMLEFVRGEKSRLKQRMDELDEREAIILKWIEQEEGPFQHELPATSLRTLIPPRRAKPTLQELFREVMQDGKPRTNADLGEIAKLRGIIGDEIDLRTVHSTMMSLMNAGEVTRRDDKWIRKVGN
jgi:hypothetical protein